MTRRWRRASQRLLRRRKCGDGGGISGTYRGGACRRVPPGGRSGCAPLAEAARGRPHRDLRLRASTTAAASRAPPRVTGIWFSAWSISSFMTRRISSSDWSTPAASKSLRILLNTSLRYGSCLNFERLVVLKLHRIDSRPIPVPSVLGRETSLPAKDRNKFRSPGGGTGS
jgi:hypothetical protein